MAKITREKVEEINAKCKNGFELDVTMFVMYGEKQVQKYIDLENGKKLRATLSFRDRRFGYTFKPVLSLHLSLWEQDFGEMLVSRGLGATIDLTEPYERKKFNDIILKTSEFDDNKILELASQHMEQLNNPCIVGFSSEV